MALHFGRARPDTPGRQNIAHFNSAGASIMPASVLEAVQRHLQLEAEIGGYEAADAQADALEHTYRALARLLGCTSEEIALVENATRGWDMAFYSTRFQPGDLILTSVHEYGSNYIAYLQVAKRTGAVIEVLPNDEHGQVSTDAVRKALDRGRVALVGLTHIPATGGLVNPVEEVGRLTQAAGVPFLLDACQSVGQWPIDVDKIGCDMLCGTGRKWLRGARGTGFLYVRRSMIEKLEPPLLDLKAARLVDRTHYELEPTARRFETWESNVAGMIGLGVAVDYALERGIETIRARVVPMAERLRGSLASIRGVTVQDVGLQKSGIVTFTVRGQDPVTVRDKLRGQRVNVSSIGRRSTPLEFEQRGLDLIVRAAFHYFNTEDEVERLVSAVHQIARDSQ
jgi:selenocysteine lyase/cysteine desulfurase